MQGSTRPYLAVIFVLVVGLGLVAAGCGNQSSKPPSAAPTTAGNPPSVATERARFTSCLESHGVPASVASGGFGASRPPSSGTTTDPIRTQYGSAFQACRSLIASSIGTGGFRDSQAMKDYIDCLESHGVTIPSTPPGTAPGVSRPGVQSNPGFGSAQAACASLRPDRTPPPAATTTTQGGS